MGRSWLEILEDPLTRKLLGHEATMAEAIPFMAGVESRLKFLLQDPLKHLSFAKIGYTALEAFLQANCTGPSLDFDSTPVIIPELYHNNVEEIKQEMLKSLSVDGLDVYPLTPRIELFWLAKCIMNSAILAEEGFNGRRARFRVNSWHQKSLSEPSDTLRSVIEHDAAILETQLSSRLTHDGAAAQEHMIEFLVERADIKIYYGDDKGARADLLHAARLREFDFALTGALGKRTKYQEKETSQLVVLAKSRDVDSEPYNSRKNSRAESNSRKSSFANRSTSSASGTSATLHSPIHPAQSITSIAAGTLPPNEPIQPENIPLKDDTILESIQFTAQDTAKADPMTELLTDESALPPSLASVDPAFQPQLHPMDSIILLGIASSITNTQASDGLTREETLPYATRVLAGGSSNWSVYSQALLVRSRIEGYRSRTAERALLQLQALVDQVIAETTEKTSKASRDFTTDSESTAPSKFLPKLTKEEDASVTERLRFIHQIQPPFRWELEAELASRWTSMGGLKTALEIYERLQMHAEIALCLAATDRGPEAVAHIKKLMFLDPDQSAQDGDTIEMVKPLPAETPRLLCILGDIQQEPKYYVLAWDVSEQRYARAQRSLGKFYLKNRDLPSAIRAYGAALRISRQDLLTWFSLGCVHLELEEWEKAVEAFTKVVSLEDKDAQGWSNLAVALLRLPALAPDPAVDNIPTDGLATIDEAVPDGNHALDALRHRREALRALRRASQIQRDDARIWDNYLTVAASIPPDHLHPERSTPWQEVIQAMSQVIRLRHKKEGESCIDLAILGALIDHITGIWDYPEPDRSTSISNEDYDPLQNTSEVRLPFIIRALTTLIEMQIAPLATSLPELFLLMSKFALWRHRPADSLALIEKAWRATSNRPSPSVKDIAESTKTLVDAYRTLGQMERERTGGQVEKGWRFKARSCVRSSISRLKSMDKETSEDVKELEVLMEELKIDKQEP